MRQNEHDSSNGETVVDRFKNFIEAKSGPYLVQPKIKDHKATVAGDRWWAFYESVPGLPVDVNRVAFNVTAPLSMLGQPRFDRMVHSIDYYSLRVSSEMPIMSVKYDPASYGEALQLYIFGHHAGEVSPEQVETTLDGLAQAQDRDKLCLYPRGSGGL